MTTDAAGEPTPSVAAGQAGQARKLNRRLTRWWSQTPDGRTYQRRRADALVAAVGLGVVVVCGVLVANRTVVGTDVVVFGRINHWPGWLYPPMWTVQLPGVIGALPLVAAAAALLRRLRLAAALTAATLLKVSLEDVAKMFVQRDRPAETLPDVILRGQSAAHGLSFPSGHAMVIFAIAALVAPYFKSWWQVLPWALAAAVCLSRLYLGAHFPLDVAAGAGLGMFIGGMLNRVFGVPSASPIIRSANVLEKTKPLRPRRADGCCIACRRYGSADRSRANCPSADYLLPVTAREGTEIPALLVA